MWDLKRYGSNIAMIDDKGNKVTYAELDEIQKTIASAISSGGNERTLIFIICSNSIECIEGYAACLNNHIVPFMISPNMPENIFDNLCKSYLPQYIWMPIMKTIIGKTVYHYKGYKLVKIHNHRVAINDDLALLLSTSGTTGSRKTVRISYKNIETNTQDIVSALSINENDRAVTMLPMHYTYGLSVINTHLYVGARLLVTDKKTISSKFWDFFNENKGTSLSGVAYTYKMLMKMGFDKWKLPYLKKITQAGERLSPDVYLYLSEMSEKRNIDFQPMYGQTEATARISVMPKGMAKYKIGSVGLPLDSGSIELVDEMGYIIQKRNTKGRLIYKGANVAMGYAFGREELAAGDVWKGRLDTGDYAYVDEEGYIFIVWRNDEYVKVCGNRISLQELEMLLEKQFSAGEFCAKYSEGKLILECTEKNIGMVAEWICNVTGLNHNMIEIKYYNELPLSDTGKVI